MEPRKVNEVATPKLPPPPCNAQNSSGCSSALARNLRPAAVTSSTAFRLSQARPNLRSSQPDPPPTVNPPTPVVDPAVGQGHTGDAVAPAPHRDLEVMVAPEADGAGHIFGVLALRDHRGPAIDHLVGGIGRSRFAISRKRRRSRLLGRDLSAPQAWRATSSGVGWCADALGQ